MKKQSAVSTVVRTGLFLFFSIISFPACKSSVVGQHFSIDWNGGQGYGTTEVKINNLTRDTIVCDRFNEAVAVDDEEYITMVTSDRPDEGNPDSFKVSQGGRLLLEVSFKVLGYPTVTQNDKYPFQFAYINIIQSAPGVLDATVAFGNDKWVEITSIRHLQ